MTRRTLGLLLWVLASACAPASHPPDYAHGQSTDGTATDGAQPARQLSAREAYQAELDAGPVDVDALAEEMRRVEVTMYMTTWCPHCMRAERWLTRGGYDFQELDIESDQGAARDLAELNPRGSVPTFDVEGHVVRGFDPYQLEHVIRLVARRRLAKR